MINSSNHDALRNFLLRDKAAADTAYGLPSLDAALAGKLVERIDNAPLFIHAYAFHLNFRLGVFTPWELLSFAKEHGLAGILIHVAIGGERSICAMDDVDLSRFGDQARDMGLRIHIETSATARDDLAQATAIAHHLGAETVRFYPRHEGKVSEVMAWTIEALKQLGSLDPEGSLYYYLEQHEDLKSYELVEIIKEVNNPRFSLLFDFGNMVNAGELPDDALTIMAPYVNEVHVKDLTIVEDRGGWGHLGCKSGTGDINMPLLMFRLLLLGEDEPQVRAFGLEEAVGFFAPAFRFPDEEDDPFIPFRGPSITEFGDDDVLGERLVTEGNDAIEQVIFIKDMLAQMRDLALALATDKLSEEAL